MCVAPAAGKVTFAGAVHSTASESGVAHIESADSPQDVRLRPALTITDKRRSSTSAALSVDRRQRQTLVYLFVNYR